MEIRELGSHEVLPALHLIWEVFVRDVAPSYTLEGIGEFRKTIKYETVLSMYRNREITMFGAFEGRELIGTISVKNSGHIFLFFVKGACQGRGAGRQLFEAACRHCALRLGVRRITVNAASGAAAKYIHMGMRPVMPEQMEKGMRYTPMEMYVNPPAPYADNRTGWKPERKEENRTPFLIIGIVIAVLLLFMVLFTGIRIVTDSIFRFAHEAENYRQRRYEEWYYDWYENGGYGDYFDDTESTGGVGLDAILPSIGENLSYEIKEGNYTFMDQEKQNVYVEFFVRYPELAGLDEDLQSKVNQALKDCAMESVEALYIHPSAKIREAVLEAPYPTLTSYVQYKVCSASDNFLSVAFEDYSCHGSDELYHENLRTVNISLKDGTVYQIGDVININDGFVDLWLERMREGAAGKRAFQELDRGEIKETFAGNSLGGVYVVNFFFDQDGINIGYDLNYEEGDPNDVGCVWVTAAFGKEEIEEYMTDKEFGW